MERINPQQLDAKERIKSFKEVDIYDLSETDREEYYFKAGYSYFRRKNIPKAKKYFYELLNKFFCKLITLKLRAFSFSISQDILSIL